MALEDKEFLQQYDGLQSKYYRIEYCLRDNCLNVIDDNWIPNYDARLSRQEIVRRVRKQNIFELRKFGFDNDITYLEMRTQVKLFVNFLKESFPEVVTRINYDGYMWEILVNDSSLVEDTKHRKAIGYMLKKYFYDNNLYDFMFGFSYEKEDNNDNCKF